MFVEIIHMKFQIVLPEQFKDRPRPFIIAHRGDCVRQPENSMAAFRLALAEGAEALETDLRITRDRVIVCHHDRTLERVTGHQGRVDALTLAEIQALRLIAPDGSVTDQSIPTFDELLSELGQKTFFLLELKTPQWTNAEDVALLMEGLRRHQVVERAVIASFSREILAAVRAAAPDLWLSPIMLWNLWPPAGYPMIGVIWLMLFLNPLYVWLCHRRGQLFCPLDPTPEFRLGFYRRMGVDFMLSDDPIKTAAALKRFRD
jgi:glycerophosphoryl diester phosphodiesterase